MSLESRTFCNFLLHVLNNEDFEENIGMITIGDNHKDDKAIFIDILNNIDMLKLNAKDKRIDFSAKVVKKNRDEEINPNYLALLNMLKKQGRFEISKHLDDLDFAKELSKLTEKDFEEYKKEKKEKKTPIDYKKITEIAGGLIAEGKSWDLQMDDKDKVVSISLEQDKEITFSREEIEKIIELIKCSHYFVICLTCNDEGSYTNTIRLCGIM